LQVKEKLEREKTFLEVARGRGERNLQLSEADFFLSCLAKGASMSSIRQTQGEDGKVKFIKGAEDVKSRSNWGGPEEVKKETSETKTRPVWMYKNGCISVLARVRKTARFFFAGALAGDTSDKGEIFFVGLNEWVIVLISGE